MPRIASKPATLLLLAMTSAVPLVLLNTAAAQHKPHQQKHVEREQIEHLEDEFQKAQLGDDVAAMDRLLSEDYLGINANGEVFTKTQQLDHMRNRSLVITQLEPSDVKIKLIGQIAIVTSMVQADGELDGVALRGRYRYTRIYQRLPSGVWKVTNFEVTRIRRPDQQASR
jgi:ketosteroid isomerase-like protein